MDNLLNELVPVVIDQKPVKTLSTPHGNAKKLVELMELESLIGNGEIGVMYNDVTESFPKDGSVMVLFLNTIYSPFITTSHASDFSVNNPCFVGHTVHSFPLNESNDSFIRNCYWF